MTSGGGLVDARLAAMCAAVETRLHSRLNSLAAAASTSLERRPPLSPEPRAAARCSAAPEGCGGTANTLAVDNLAAAWPCTMASGGSRRRRSARSLDGTETGGRRSAHHSRAPHSSRSARPGGHHRSGFSQALLERIERLEGAAAASAAGAAKLSAASAAAAAPPVATPFAFPSRQGDGSQSPPLSAERRHAMTVERSRHAMTVERSGATNNSPGLEC